MPDDKKRGLCREVLIAMVASASLVTTLVAVEYATIRSLWPDSFQEPLGSHITDFAVSANGAQAAFIVSQGPSLTQMQARRFDLGTLDMKTGRTEQIEAVLPANPTAILPSNLRGVFYIGCADGSIVYCDASTTGIFTYLVGRGAGAPSDLLMANDGKTLIVRDESISGWDIETASLRWQLSLPEHRCATIDPTGASLYCGFQSGRILRVEAATGATQWLRCGRDKEILKVALSPTGDLLATVTRDGRLDVVGLEEDKILWSSRASISTTPTFTANGRQLLVADAGRQSRLISLDAVSGVQRYVLGDHRWAMGLRHTPTGTLFTWSNDGSIAAWDLAQRRRAWISKPAEKGSPFGIFASSGATVP